MMEKISVCMATFNGARFIREQIDSILPQLNKDDEFIITDDGSTDETLSIIMSYHDNRFTIINNNRSGSPAKSFEKGLSYCSGDYIFLSDQDDVWAPSKVAVMKTHLQEHALVLSDCSVIDEQNHIIKNSFFAQQKSKPGFTQNLIKNSYMGCCMAFHKKLLKHILPFPDGLQTHDQWIGLIAEKHYDVQFINQPLVKYRRHGNNYSPTGEKSILSFREKLNYRMHMLYNVYNR